MTATARQPGLSNVERLHAAATDDASARNVGTVVEVMEGFTRGDFTVLASRMAPAGQTFVSGFTPERLGPHLGNPNFVADTFCNGMHFEIKAAASTADVVFVEWHDDARTHRDERYENDGISVFHFGEDGTIVAYHEYIDHEKFFAVL